MTKWKLYKQIQLTSFGHSTCTSTSNSPIRRVTETIGAFGAKKSEEKSEKCSQLDFAKTSGVHFLFY